MAISFVSSRQGHLTLDDLDVSEPTNGDAAQLIFRVDAVGRHELAFVNPAGEVTPLGTLIVGEQLDN